jgi:hypothetical protein
MIFDFHFNCIIRYGHVKQSLKFWMLLEHSLVIIQCEASRSGLLSSFFTKRNCETGFVHEATWAKLSFLNSMVMWYDQKKISHREFQCSEIIVDISASGQPGVMWKQTKKTVLLVNHTQILYFSLYTVNPVISIKQSYLMRSRASIANLLRPVQQ